MSIRNAKQEELRRLTHYGSVHRCVPVFVAFSEATRDTPGTDRNGKPSPVRGLDTGAAPATLASRGVIPGVTHYSVQPR
ncbi:unnamed protein product, partial [marine sediment metagenome]